MGEDDKILIYLKADKKDAEKLLHEFPSIT